jgi:hypothetical protein
MMYHYNDSLFEHIYRPDFNYQKDVSVTRICLLPQIKPNRYSYPRQTRFYLRTEKLESLKRRF